MKLPKNNEILEYKESPKYPDEIGMVFGYLTILEEIENDSNADYKILYMLKCKCGKEILRYRRQLYGIQKEGFTQSCGCRRIENCKTLLSDIKTKHGKAKKIKMVNEKDYMVYGVIYVVVVIILMITIMIVMVVEVLNYVRNGMTLRYFTNGLEKMGIIKI